MAAKNRNRILGILAALLFLCYAAFLIKQDEQVDHSGWHTLTTGLGYRNFQGDFVTGWQEIDGEYYHFGFDYAMNTGWLDIDGADYYLDSDGKRVSGWNEIQGNSYFFDDNGILQTGWQVRNGKSCYLGEDGLPASGWLKDGENTYYLDADGFPACGLLTLDEQTYFFGADGVMTTGWQEAEGLTRYFLEDGTMASGFTPVEEHTYYFREDGAFHTGWFARGEYDHYFHDDGTMAVGPTVIDGNQHYFTPKGIHVILVNPWNTLPPYLELDLVDIGNWQSVDRSCLEALNQMMADCTAAGHYPYICSSYRTWEDQEYLMENKIKRLMKEEHYSREVAAEIAKESVAVPGTSEHQLGLAVDIVANGYYVLDYTQAKTKTQAWLMEHCWEYGFILRYPDNTTDITGIIYEPWHYRYVGTEVSLELRDLGITLEEYLDAVFAYG